jgi:hypothetical protein
MGIPDQLPNEILHGVKLGDDDLRIQIHAESPLQASSVAEGDPFPPYRILLPAAYCGEPAESLEDLALELHRARAGRGLLLEDYQLAWENPQGMRAAIWVRIQDGTPPTTLMVSTAGEDATTLNKALRQTRQAARSA